MGCSSSKDGADPKQADQFTFFPDKYSTLEALQEDLEREGLESCNLILGIDYTASNDKQGRMTYQGRPLHFLDPDGDSFNPYQQVIHVLGRTLARFDEDNLIPCFGFGDLSTKDHSVFPFYADRDCEGFQEVLRRYMEVTPTRRLSGPTNFAPLIYKAVEIVGRSGRNEYHILVIIADGQVTHKQETVEAIVYASHFSLSIVMVGVGDGPWELMEHFDDELPTRKFDNFQFVNFHAVCSGAKNLDTSFAHAALMEVPQQYKAIKSLGLMGRVTPNVPHPVTGR